ncbi:MAG: methyltransferase [Promethearchaeota archaeon]|jgi:protein-S-isoprenylcysteine O-methyltransferase Ste14
MNELIIYNLLTLCFGLASLIFFVILFFITAGYGQHINKKWGPAINNKLGWIIMEVPTVIVFLIYFLVGERKTDVLSLIFLLIWMLHYFQRTFIFPLLMRGKELMPVTIILLGITFNGINAYLQARWLYTFSPPYAVSWVLNPLFIIGLLIFLCGFVINLHSDRIIRNLRAPGETEYKIPYGGMYKYVSCPSYFGEITEWVGWAIMTWSVPGLIFAVWTFANLAPRARSNHLWYKKSFPEYPTKRKALIPFIF